MHIRKLVFAGFFAVLMAVACNNVVDGTPELKAGWYRLVDSGQGVARQLASDIYYLHPDPILTTANFATLTAEPFPPDSSLWQVVTHLDDHGRESFAQATEQLIGQDLIFVIDDTLWSTPVRIHAQIPNGVMTINKSQFAEWDAKALIDRIEAMN